tara:strand:+ start:372 stop:734 length:363 start_codon:yes stop_codon:yes gene_type:complete
MTMMTMMTMTGPRSLPPAARRMHRAHGSDVFVLAVITAPEGQQAALVQYDVHFVMGEVQPAAEVVEIYDTYGNLWSDSWCSMPTSMIPLHGEALTEEGVKWLSEALTDAIEHMAECSKDD